MPGNQRGRDKLEGDKLDRILAQWRRERPDLDPEPMAVFGRLARLACHLDREIQKGLAEFGLPPGGFDVLATLRRAGAPYRLSPNDLLQWMMITSGTMTHRLDQLERLGLVERQPNPGDRRGVLVGLTPKGKDVVDAAVARHLDNERRLLDWMAPEDRIALGDLLRRFLARFEA